jgi:hypothetical protein
MLKSVLIFPYGIYFMEYFFRCNGNFIIHMEFFLHEIDSIWKNYYLIKFLWYNHQKENKDKRGRVRIRVFNATFNNISVISWRSVLLVEETGGHFSVWNLFYGIFFPL